MGKTPKKAAPGGDERNSCVRRLKATTTLSSKDCDTNLTVRWRESDNSNRIKPIGAQKRSSVPVSRIVKAATTCKDEKKIVVSSTNCAAKSQESDEGATMRTETEESTGQPEVSIKKKDSREVGGGEKNSRIEGTNGKKEEDESCPTRSSNSTNGNEIVDLAEAEKATPRGERSKDTITDSSVDKKIPFDENAEKMRYSGSDDSVEMIKTADEVEAVSSESSDESSLKLVDEPEPPVLSTEIGEDRQCALINGRSEDQEILFASNEKIVETPTADNCSVDVVESTTTETLLDSGNATQTDCDDASIGRGARDTDSPAGDPLLISYDSSIMLKDVQIKLNDCLKENSKLLEMNDFGETMTTTTTTNFDEQQQKRLSFGKTLRNISGRGTIDRLRFITVREQRFSPSSSLFVNTSSSSMDSDEALSSKLARSSADIAETNIRNGNRFDRKRKVADDAVAASKKLKSDTSGFLNASIEMIKSIRRPAQGTALNTKRAKYQSDKFIYKTLNDEKLPIDPEVDPKKWCVVM